jgi:hypothetical protein
MKLLSTMALVVCLCLMVLAAPVRAWQPANHSSLSGVPAASSHPKAKRHKPHKAKKHPNPHKKAHHWI